MFQCDVVRGRRPPFDPQQVVEEFVTLVKQFGIYQVTGDRYSAEWVASAFSQRGIRYVPSDKSKSDIYLEVLPLFTRGVISIPDLPPLIRELRLLERQTHRGGRDTVDHPKRGSDDFANALAGCASISVTGGFDIRDLDWIDGPKPADPREAWRKQQYDRLMAHIYSHVR
jgi:hypothetical protein